MSKKKKTKKSETTEVTEETESSEAAEGTALPSTEGTNIQDELAGGGTAPADGSLRRSNRMEFDERLVKGQVAKSGAVYLFKRVPRRLPGLVGQRRSYRKRIVLPVLGHRKLKRVVYSKKKEELDKKKQTKEETVTHPKPAATGGQK